MHSASIADTSELGASVKRREVPVLFHLRDVSRPPPAPTAQQPHTPPATVAGEVPTSSDPFPLGAASIASSPASVAQPSFSPPAAAPPSPPDEPSPLIPAPSDRQTAGEP